MVDVLRQLKNDDKYVTQTQAEDVVYVGMISLMYGISINH